MNVSRITIFAGHYGSGKTSLAVNYALWLAQSGKDVSICDLDIVNPYFRTADYAQLFTRHGIKLIASPYANSSLEIPSVPADAEALFANHGRYGIIDLGGDDRGALAMGRYAKHFTEGGDYTMFLVVNIYRPLSREARDILKIKNEIENASGVRFTALINNSNLGKATGRGDIEASFPVVEALSRETGLKVKMVTAIRALADEGITPIDIYEKPTWKV